jgi:hypothetical protein
MPWHDPITWLFQQLVTERDMNEQIRDNMRVLKTPITDDGKLKPLSPAEGTNDLSTGANTRLVIPVGPDKWAV